MFVVDTNELQRVLNEIKSRITSAQTDIDNAKNATADLIPGDRFAQSLEVNLKLNEVIHHHIICLSRVLLKQHGMILKDLMH